MTFVFSYITLLVALIEHTPFSIFQRYRML